MNNAHVPNCPPHLTIEDVVDGFPQRRIQVQMFAIYIDAPAPKIWDAITSSEFTTRFGYGGEIEIDLTPGGAVRDLTTPEMKEMGMRDVAGAGG